MNVGEFAKAIWEQFLLVGHAPVPFLTAVLFAGWLIWLFVKHSYDIRLANADSTKQLLERKLQDYSDKLSGASPDEAKARMDALEARLDAMGPRKVSPEKRQDMVKILSKFSGQLASIAHDAGASDAQVLSKGIAAAFTDSGWRVQLPMVMGLGNPPQTGIGVSVANPAQLTPEEQSACDALRSAGLDFDLQVGAKRWNDRENFAVEIVVSRPLDG